MKKEDWYDRIKQLRNSKENRTVRPYNNFMEKINRSEKLFEIIEKKISYEDCINEALYQYVISDITAFEVYFKDIFLAVFKLCKDYEGNLKKCNKLVEKRFDLEDFVVISSRGILLEEIILASQNFQNISDIEKTFSTLTGKSFIGNLKGRTFTSGGLEAIMFQLDEDFYTKLIEYLDLRHSLVHDFDPMLRLKKEKIEELHDNLLLFIVASDVYLHRDFIEPNLRNEFLSNI